MANPFFCKYPNSKFCINEHLINFFNGVLFKFNINIQLTRFSYVDYSYEEKYNEIDDKYKIEILVINSQPLSGQYNYNKKEWDDYIISLNKKYKIATTTKVNNEILCTMDDNLTIKSIAIISTKVPIIIAINSGVIPGILNEHTLQNIKRAFMFDNSNYFSYPNFVTKYNINNITFEELDSLL
jgi:hypothetical protein